MDISVHICIKTPNGTISYITQTHRGSKGQACSHQQAVKGQRQRRDACILPQQGWQAHPPALKILQFVIETWLIRGLYHIWGFLNITGQLSEVRVNAFKSLRVLEMKHIENNNQYLSQLGPCSHLRAEVNPIPRRVLGKEEHVVMLILDPFFFCLCR